MTQDPSYVIISGGTGANAIASAFGEDPAFVLPVSDDGGSSSEILRCFGGPSIGDIRSRLTRLIPLAENPTTADQLERSAIYELLAYRFPDDASEKVVREIWGEIVEGRSPLWKDIGDDKKECIRAHVPSLPSTLHALTLKRAHKRFSFRNFSLGNGFLTGARDMFGSLPSAIFLFKSVASVAPGTHVIPVINTNQTVTIAAELENGHTIVGQCAISHPAIPVPAATASPEAGLLQLGGTGAGVPVGRSGSMRRTHFRRDSRTFDTTPTVQSAETSPKLDDVKEEVASGGNLGYRKGAVEVPLESPVKRVFYINLYGQEIFPQPNSNYLDALKTRDVLVYSCGSIWTSIAPCLSLRGLGVAVASSNSLKAKVLLLNSKNDRESPDYRASDYVRAITDSLTPHSPQRSTSVWSQITDISNLLTHVVYLEGGQVEVDEDVLLEMGVKTIQIPRPTHGFDEAAIPLFTPETVTFAMAQVMQALA